MARLFKGRRLSLQADAEDGLDQREPLFIGWKRDAKRIGDLRTVHGCAVRRGARHVAADRPQRPLERGVAPQQPKRRRETVLPFLLTTTTTATTTSRSNTNTKTEWE